MSLTVPSRRRNIRRRARPMPGAAAATRYMRMHAHYCTAVASRYTP
jgi:hypothetical protein